MIANMPTTIILFVLVRLRSEIIWKLITYVLWSQYNQKMIRDLNTAERPKPDNNQTNIRDFVQQPICADSAGRRTSIMSIPETKHCFYLTSDVIDHPLSPPFPLSCISPKLTIISKTMIHRMIEYIIHSSL